MRSKFSFIFVALSLFLNVALRAQDDAIGKDFGENYKRLVEQALNTKVGDAEFWAKAHELVFGQRVATTDTSKAAEIFKTNLTKVPVEGQIALNLPIFHADTLEGRAMKKTLDATIEKYKAKPALSSNELLEIIEAAAPFLRTSELGARSQKIIVPPKSVVTYTGQPFCLQHDAPAPGHSNPMWLITSDALFPPKAREIAQALLKYSANYPVDHGVIQSLLWAIRHADKNPRRELSSEQQRVLDSALPDGVKKYQEYLDSLQPDKKDGLKNTPSTHGPNPHQTDPSIGSWTDDSTNNDTVNPINLDAQKKKVAENNLENTGLELVDHKGLDPLDPNNVNRIYEQLVNATVNQAKNKTKQKQETDLFNSEGFNSLDSEVGPSKAVSKTKYNAGIPGLTTLDNETAVRVTGNGLSNATVEIANKGDTSKEVDLSRFAGFAPQTSQPVYITPPSNGGVTAKDKAIADQILQGVFNFLKSKEGELKGVPAFAWLNEQAIAPFNRNAIASLVVQEGLRAIPIFGNGIALYEAVSGKDIFTGKPLSPTEQVLAWISIPPVGVNMVARLARIPGALNKFGRAASLINKTHDWSKIEKFAERFDTLEEGLRKGTRIETLEKWKDRLDLAEKVIAADWEGLGETWTVQKVTNLISAATGG